MNNHKEVSKMKVLVVVDMQNDFIDGALGSKEAAAIVSNVVKRIESAENELVLYTQDTHGDDYLSTPEGKKLPVPHCIKGTDGWKINSEVANAYRGDKNSAKCFEKPVFGSVALVEHLVSLNNEQTITNIELLGLCTDVCVVSNAIMLKNYLPHVEVSVNENCCAGITPQSHAEAINTMKMCQIDII
jgi:nicotinamidase-related amidase